jgi:hypothetical protein
MTMMRMRGSKGIDVLGAVLLLALLALALAARSLSLSRQHESPLYDEVAYLEMARDFSERGGVIQVIRCHLSGDCREDNRHPLYPLLTAPFMRGGSEDFARAKLLTLSCALVLLLVVFAMSRAMWGQNIALAAVALVALSPAASYLSSRVLADVLLAVLYFAGVWLATRCDERPGPWIGLGILAGLAYLTKGNGHVLIVAGLAGGLINRRRRLWTTPGFYYGLLAFLVVSSWLLCRNALVWGNPLHNVNGRIIWLDGWPQMWRISATPEWESVGPLWYWHHHSLAQALARFGYGTMRVMLSLLRVMSIGPMGGGVVSGIVLLGLALAALRERWRSGPRAEVLAPASAGLVLLGALAWSVQALGLGDRFLFPIAISLAPLAALGGHLAWRRWAPREAVRTGPALLRAAIVISALAVLMPHRGVFGEDPRLYWRVAQNEAETCVWIRKHVGNGGVLTHFMSRFSCWGGGREVRHPYPFEVPDHELRGFLDRTGCRHVLIDQAVPPVSYLEKYGASDGHGPSSFLGWSRCFHDSSAPSQLLLYSPDCAAGSP